MTFKVLFIISAALILHHSAVADPIKNYEHKLVDVCGVRDLLEANCNGATYIDSCDMCVHELVKAACPATDPADCIALVTSVCISENMNFFKWANPGLFLFIFVLFINNFTEKL